MQDIEMEFKEPVLKKKRIRRKMVNGVLVSGNNKVASDDQMDTENSIQDVGEDCQCKRYRCFEVTTGEERLRVFKWFRMLGSAEMQDLYLSNLIAVEGVKQRRPKIEDVVKRSEHSASFFYKLKIPDGDQRGYRELNVCRVAFLGILGISRNRLRTTQKMLYNQKKPDPIIGQKREDMCIPEALEALIIAHIDDYPPLTETYSVKDMHRHFRKNYRINISYNIYWLTLHAKWNIAKFKPKYTCTPTFETFFETLNMFGLIDFGV